MVSPGEFTGPLDQLPKTFEHSGFTQSIKYDTFYQSIQFQGKFERRAIRKDTRAARTNRRVDRVGFLADVPVLYLLGCFFLFGGSCTAQLIP